MRHFLNSFLTLCLFILAAGLLFIGAIVTFPTAFINIALFIIAIFVLLQACANVDKANGYGKYSATTKSDKEEPIEGPEGTDEDK